MSESLPRERSECFGHEQRRVALFQAQPEGLGLSCRRAVLSVAHLILPNYLHLRRLLLLPDGKRGPAESAQYAFTGPRVEVIATGHLRKMLVALTEPVAYTLPLDQVEVPLNRYIGAALELRYSGAIACVHCGRNTKKSFNQGYCYPCFKRLARCDQCIVSPEKCHYAQGTCREPQWGERFCMTEHIVYLANSSGPKVGITRASQVPVRWIDQGSVQALPLLRVQTRHQSGLVEDQLRRFVADRTNWRAMLKGEGTPVDLPALAAQLLEQAAPAVRDLQQRWGLQAVQPVADAVPVDIHYPVTEYPEKITTHNFDKQPLAGGRLMGIKGQYLLFDTGVLNIRKFTAYHVELAAEAC